MDLALITLAFFLGGLVGFFLASLMSIRHISELEQEKAEECPTCGHPSWFHFDLDEGDMFKLGCEGCLDGRCGGGYIPRRNHFKV